MTENKMEANMFDIYLKDLYLHHRVLHHNQKFRTLKQDATSKI